jgi:hypothetical protein
MEEQPILVLRATGTTGRRVAGRLRAVGYAVRAASRRGEVRFDWSDPGSWEPAVVGTARMYLMAPHEWPVDPSFVRFAVKQGVRHIVLLSSRGKRLVAPGAADPEPQTVRHLPRHRTATTSLNPRNAFERPLGSCRGHRCLGHRGGGPHVRDDTADFVTHRRTGAGHEPRAARRAPAATSTACLAVASGCGTCPLRGDPAELWQCA